jgi:hypothetical protein
MYEAGRSATQHRRSCRPASLPGLPALPALARLEASPQLVDFGLQLRDAPELRPHFLCVLRSNVLETLNTRREVFEGLWRTDGRGRTWGFPARHLTQGNSVGMKLLHNECEFVQEIMKVQNCKPERLG